MKPSPHFISHSIQNKLFASFLLVLLLLVAVVTVSYITISNLGKASDKILKMNYNSIIASINMMDDLESIHREFLSANTSEMSESKLQLVAAQNSLSQWLGRSKDNITEPGEKQILAELEVIYNKYLALLQKFPDSETDQIQLEELDSYRRSIKKKCMHLLQINQKAMFTKSAAAQRISQQGTTTLFLVAILVMVLGVALSWGLSRRIVRPIVTLKDATRRIAAGDYSVQLHQESEDELGILTHEFDQMAGKLRAFNELNIRKIVAEQQKIEAIFANIQDGIFFVGLDFLVLDANLPALEAFKLKRPEVIGHHFLEIIKQDMLFNDLKKCMETQTATVYPEHENLLTLRHGEKQLYYEYTFTPVMSLQKELLGVMFLLRDITSLKELNRLESEFVMIVSHELKTPLTSLSMSIDLLRESLGANPKTGDLELIKIAKEEINRLRLLVNDLLDLSKIEAGKIDMHFAEANPKGILDAVQHYFKPQVSEKKALMDLVDRS